MKLTDLKQKRILILGLGKEGIDTFKFLRKIGVVGGWRSNNILGLADRLELGKLSSRAKKLIYHIFHDRRKCSIKLYLGEKYLEALKNYDVIVKSPGISIHLPEIKRAYKQGKITSQTEIFLENCPGKIVGIAGTKGKSTTASLIYKILKEGGIKAHLVGNIGKPVLSLLFSASPKDVYVYELSSHQLYNLKKSPPIAILLNIFPDHLDYYKNFKEYAEAEQKIAYWQTNQDYLIFNSSDKFCQKATKISKAKKIPINIRSIKKIIKIKDIPLKGEFNLQNVAASIKVGKIFGIPPKKIKRAIKNFKPLAHRLELVGVYQGIKFYNDSLSVIPETTIAAMEALGNNVKTLFLGGFERHLDFTKLAKKVLKSKIKTLILFPTTGEKIWREIKKQIGQEQFLTELKHFFVDNMADAVRLAYNHTRKGKICLLSSASPSFGLFQDYKERGNLFKKYVKKYSQK